MEFTVRPSTFSKNQENSLVLNILTPSIALVIFFFFLFRSYGPFKNILLISS